MDEKIVLHDVSMVVEPGQKVAFVGSTGAGKTTITNLLNRFYDIQDGKIRIDGININKIKKRELRRAFGVVLQDTHLFTGTIKDNIRYGRLKATDEEVIAAAKLANAHSFIRQLPDGYDTVLTGDGANLSQGQRQLLAISRAILADPKILILDEPTTGLDPNQLLEIRNLIKQIGQSKTILLSTHIMQEVEAVCSRVIIINNGRLVADDETKQLSAGGSLEKKFREITANI